MNLLRSVIATLFILTGCSISFAQTFTNPIAASGADPWVTQHDGYYYRCYASSGNSITVTMLFKLHEIENTIARVKVWTAPVGTMYSREIWAPELHRFNDRWYIYFAADDSVNKNHRMYVLESEGDNALGPYVFKGKITPLVDRWAIDGTVMVRNGTSYFIWSGWEGFSGPQNLYISKMINPWAIDTGKLVTRIEAEGAKLTNAKVRNTTSASGGKCVGSIDFADSKAEFTVTVASAGIYLLKVNFANGTTGWSTHAVTVNGAAQGSIRYPATGWEIWQHASTALVTLKAGSNVIVLGKGDGFAELDFVTLYSNTVDRVCISRPELSWEKLTSSINEGPQILVKDSTIHIVYSASASWTDNYCLGVLTLTGSNPLDIASWTKHPQTVFTKTSEVFGPGHCSFVTSPDGTQDWIVYHAAKTQGSGWSRKILTQPFTWDSRNFPVFGTPIPDGVAITVPSGSNPYYPVPGRVQAQHYFQMSGVQQQITQDESGVANVGWLHEGDWIEYRLKVAAAGVFPVDLRVASGVSGGVLELVMADSTRDTVLIPNTGGSQNWTTISSAVRLSEGEQTVRMNIIKGGFNLNWFDFQSDATPVTPHRVNFRPGATAHYFEAYTAGGRRVLSGALPANAAGGTGFYRHALRMQSRGVYLVRLYAAADVQKRLVSVTSVVIP